MSLLSMMILAAISSTFLLRLSFHDFNVLPFFTKLYFPSILTIVINRMIKV